MNTRDYAPVVSAGGILVVFDDACRLRWERSSPYVWTLGATWPDNDERKKIDAHLADGGCLLVVTDGRDIVTSAWPQELSAASASASHDTTVPADEMVEIRVNHFDWLPADLRARGDQFVDRERTRWSREPAILRPALTLDAETDFHTPGQVVFAMTAPNSSRGWVEREIVRYLDHVQTGYRMAASS